MRADSILRQLQKRHARGQVPDAFYTEVKNGPTIISNNLLIMDAVAFKKSWKNPCITGYEIKVSRQDFLRDEKWPGYLNYCHRFYFACPKDLIAPADLPDNVGLIYYNQEKDCIRTKRKAAFRDIEIPWEMLYYLVIARLENDRHPFFSDQREMLEAFVQDKEDRQQLGRMVNEKIFDLQNEVRKLKREMEWRQSDIDRARKVEEILRKYGLNFFKLEDDLEKALSRGMPPDVANGLERIGKEVDRLRDLVGA